MMEHLFDKEKSHFAAWVWLYDMDHHWVEPMSETHPTQPEAVPLYYASLCGFRGLVKHLVVAVPSDANARGGSYMTPLHAASAMGHSDIVRLLLQNNANPNSAGVDGVAPLHTASEYGHIDVVKVLLSYSTGEKTNGEEYALLHPTSANGDSEVDHFPIQSRAVVDMPNDNQTTPLYVAAANGYLDIARFLLNSGANVNTTNKFNWTPLHTAAYYGSRDIVQLFLDFGANFDARDEDQVTPLDVACQYGMVEVSCLLIDSGSDVNSRDKDGWTPLHSASRYGHLASGKPSSVNCVQFEYHGVPMEIKSIQLVQLAPTNPMQCAHKYIFLLDHICVQLVQFTPLTCLSLDASHGAFRRGIFSRAAFMCL
jgi:ankyrin repeat protein